jgi:hypothetical protein
MSLINVTGHPGGGIEFEVLIEEILGDPAEHGEGSDDHVNAEGHARRVIRLGGGTHIKQLRL